MLMYKILSCYLIHTKASVVNIHHFICSMHITTAY